MTQQSARSSNSKGVTLIELVVVVLIISILSLISTGVYTGEVKRARVASAFALIHNMEIAIARYEIDTGFLPPSGTASTSATLATRLMGTGLLHAALVHGLNSTPVATWKGPYIDPKAETLQPNAILAAANGGRIDAGTIDFIDPWGSPIIYVNNLEYNLDISSGQFPLPIATGGTPAGTQMFTGAAPTGANTVLPAPNPFATSDIYYNPHSFQLYSKGPDGQTFALSAGLNYCGAAVDDVNNFGY